MARNGSKLLKFTTSLQALIRRSPDFQGLPSPWNHSKTLKMNYLYLKHPWIHRKCTLEQVSSEGSTAQNGQKGLKMAEIRCFKQNFTNSREIGNPLWARASRTHQTSLRPKPSEYVPQMGVFYIWYEETYPPRALVSAIEAQNQKSPQNQQKPAKSVGKTLLLSQSQLDNGLILSILGVRPSKNS